MINKFGKMRDSWFTKIILSITALSFMSLFGVSGYINYANSNKSVIKVDDIEISQSEFSYLLQRQLLTLKSQNLIGDDEDGEIKTELANALAHSKLQEALLENTMHKYKVDFSDALVGQVIMQSPEFMNDGKFDAEMFKWYLNRSGKKESDVVRDIKLNIARQILLDTQVAFANVPNVLQQQMTKVLGQRRTFKYAKLANDKVAITRQPTVDELDQYYDDFAEEFTIGEKRDLTVMFLSQETIENNIKVSAEEIDTYYKEHIDEFEQPEQREVLQLVFDDEETAKAAYSELTSGKDFMSVAAQHSQNAEDVKLGFVSKNDISEELAEVVFNLPQGQMSKPQNIADLWQIVKVAAVKTAAKTPRAEAEKQIISELRQEKAYDDAYAMMSAIEDKLGSETSLADIAKEYNAPLYKISKLDENGDAAAMDSVLQKVMNNQDVLETAFSYNEGETSQTIETDDGMVVILVDKVYESHQQPRQEAEAKLHQLWAENERAAITQETIDNIQHDIEAGDDFSTVAKRYGLQIINTRPLSRAETFDSLTIADMKSLFGAAKNEPQYIKQGEDYIIAETTAVYDDSASLTPQEKEAVSRVMYASMVQEMSEALLKDFAKNYKVEVNYNRMGLID